MRIIFMGTPEFAIPSVDILNQAGYDIVAVVTAADKPAGRGRKLRPSPIKQYALDHQIPALQPLKLRDPDFLAELEALQPDLMVVVAFRMLPKVVWSIPRLGTFNLHAAMLPDYRGAAPINWVLINGEASTGLTTFLIDEQIDTGNVLLQTGIPIPYEWTAGDLHDYMMDAGAELVLRTVQGLETGSIQAKPQDDSLFKHKAPKIYKEDCQINWDQPVQTIYNFIRGLSPYPAAWTKIDGKTLKIFRAVPISSPEKTTPSQIIWDSENESISIAAQDGWLRIEELQIEGKKRMATDQFYRGADRTIMQLD